jgi:hypothetical protein
MDIVKFPQGVHKTVMNTMIRLDTFEKHVYPPCPASLRKSSNFEETMNFKNENELWYIYLKK